MEKWCWNIFLFLGLNELSYISFSSSPHFITSTITSLLTQYHREHLVFNENIFWYSEYFIFDIGCDWWDNVTASDRPCQLEERMMMTFWIRREEQLKTENLNGNFNWIPLQFSRWKYLDHGTARQQTSDVKYTNISNISHISLQIFFIFQQEQDHVGHEILQQRCNRFEEKPMTNF